jgi:hypothetical protein
MTVEKGKPAPMVVPPKNKVCQYESEHRCQVKAVAGVPDGVVDIAVPPEAADRRAGIARVVDGSRPSALEGK